MKKFLLTLSLSCSILFGIGNTILASEQKDIDYKTHYNVDEINLYNKDNLIYIEDNFKNILFKAESVSEYVYTTANLNLRMVPTVNSTPVVVVPKDSKVYRVGVSENGWDIVQIDNIKYFMWNEHLTIDKPNNYIEFLYDPNSLSIEELEAKEWIAQKESNGDYNAVSSSGKYIGRYQLTYTMLNGDHSPENQERVAEEYVANRYGSWVAAKAFWESNGWY